MKMDGITQFPDVCVIVATNCADEQDPGVLLSGVPSAGDGAKSVAIPGARGGMSLDSRVDLED